MTISEAEKRQYHDEGYTILRNVLTPEYLQVLRDECQHFIDVLHADALGYGILSASLEAGTLLMAVQHVPRSPLLCGRQRRQRLHQWRAGRQADLPADGLEVEFL